MTAIVAAERLTKRYGTTVTALDDVSIEVGRGEFAAVIGRSGSGKSTLMNILGCLDTPTSGSVAIGGRPVDYTDRNALVNLRRTALGFVFQQFNLIPNLTAEENVAYPLLFNYREKAERTERARMILERVGLLERATHYPSELSGGEQQRVAIARALVHDPLLVLADEPTGNLDSKTSAEILDLLRELNRDRQTTFVVVTHDRESGSLFDRTVRMVDGRVVA